MKFAFVDAEKAHFPVEVLCDVVGVSRSGFYAWRERPSSPRLASDRKLLKEIEDAYQRGRGTYGSPRVHRELRARGRRVSRKRVERVMRQASLVGRQKRRFRKTTDSRHDQPIAPNRLARRFQVSTPNTCWTTDVTFVTTGEGWLYLAVILDLFSRRVVAWATSETNDTALAVEALQRALRLRQPPAGLLHHSDRGSPYASEAYRALEAQHGIIASMSRTGDCWDNAASESFFATLRAELLDITTYRTHVEAIRAISEYIIGFYNLTRRHSSIDYVSPIEFELKHQAGSNAA